MADLAVVDGARRAGVGRALLEAGEAWTGAQGLPVLDLDVWATNERALEFYSRLGSTAESSCIVKRLRGHGQAAPPTTSS